MANAIATNTTLKELMYARSHPQPCCQDPVLTADGKKQALWTWGAKHALELAKRTVGLEHLAESDETAHLASIADAVLGETMRQKASTVSGY